MTVSSPVLRNAFGQPRMEVCRVAPVTADRARPHPLNSLLREASMKLSKLFCVVALPVLAVSLRPASVAAQWELGQKYLGAHIGLSGVGSTAAYGVNGEYAYNEHIGIGAWLDTWSYGDSYFVSGVDYGWDVRYVAIAGTGSYHFPIESQPKLDPFVGLGIGYYIVSASYNGGGVVADYGGSANRLFVGGFGGIRYAFKENLLGVARLGFGASYLTVGLDFKL
jgi:Outer membrane protein beta-barrel domain